MVTTNPGSGRGSRLMANDPLNPYAVTAAPKFSQPVHFAGILDRSDLLLSLRDTPPQSFRQWIQLPLVALFVVAVALSSASEFGQPGEPTPAFVWMLIGVVVCPLWIWGALLFTPSRRKRLRRLEMLVQNTTPSTGWLNDEYFLDQDSLST
ncbi:MAG: hypothetical protein HKN47_26650, partial [Pirellulaceae bacterium]|nr:hypothetical protein [Pirellulaceae bacterium]